MIVAKKRKEKPLKVKSAIRRCLGHGEEHNFRSPDPVCIRICNRCKRSLYKQPHHSPAKEVD